MALNINTIKQASPKANQVATEQYVDTSIASIDVSSDINANNDNFAQSQGFLSYQDMVVKYSALGKSIINGGYINSGLVAANSILANSISADKIQSYNLTSTNATIQNSMIKNAMIGDAQITSAKIQDLSVSTLKIQNEAVIVPRAATGVGSTTIYYTPYITHSVIFLLTGGFSAYNTIYRLYVNGVVWYESPSGYGERIALNILGTLYANTAYTITLDATVQSGYTVPTLQLVMLGVKR